MIASLEKHSILAVLIALAIAGLVALEVTASAVKVREYRTMGSAPVERTLTVSGTGR